MMARIINSVSTSVNMLNFTVTFLVTCYKCASFLSLGVEWGLVFPDANGEYQSPINLNSREARYDPSLLDVRLSPNYVVCRDCEVTNDGHTIQVILKSKSGILEDALHALVNSSHIAADELTPL